MLGWVPGAWVPGGEGTVRLLPINSRRRASSAKQSKEVPNHSPGPEQSKQTPSPPRTRPQTQTATATAIATPTATPTHRAGQARAGQGRTAQRSAAPRSTAQLRTAQHRRRQRLLETAPRASPFALGRGGKLRAKPRSCHLNHSSPAPSLSCPALARRAFLALALPWPARPCPALSTVDRRLSVHHPPPTVHPACQPTMSRATPPHPSTQAPSSQDQAHHAHRNRRGNFITPPLVDPNGRGV
jgi:hypothetical protein